MTDAETTQVGAIAVARRLWRAPLPLHLCVLAAVLVLCAWYTRPGFGWTSDEGAAILQAELLDHGTWIYDNPVPEVDPEGVLSPFPIGDHGSRGLAPYGKHPLYPRLLQLVGAVGGDWGLVGLSVAGTVLAAASGGLLAQRFSPSLARPALWALGLASPLFIDAFAVLAHTIAAASFGWAVLAIWESHERRSLARGALIAAGCALVVVTGLLRTEGVLAGGALGIALGALAIVWRSRWMLVAAAVTATSIGATFVTERVLVRSILGTASPRPGLRLSHRPRPWVLGRVEALWNDWLDPGVGGRFTLGVVVVVAALVLLVVGAARARIDRRGAPLALALSAALACYGIRLLSPPLELFGLFAAFPILLVGVVLLTRGQFATPLPTLLGLTTALFAAAVLATNYPVGGSIQWGGRYFAVILPVFTPLGLDAIRRASSVWQPATAHRVVALSVAVSLTVALIGLRVIRHRHDSVAATQVALSELSSVAGGAGVGAHPDRPIVVSYNRLVPQLLFGGFDRYVWLAPDVRDGSGALAAEGLAGAGVERVILFDAPGIPRGQWAEWEPVASRSTPLGRVVVIERIPR
ncbi:hypothetical protein [Rhabdothermincola sediminis]|uniref:hypothetical protein n=1 Tax=Rhabdothermincola sediminis TaxID=2751370 RepID=UPI001AA0A429|nr:hypothetical protein [Rhabdothermincola sediminis]